MTHRKTLAVAVSLLCMPAALANSQTSTGPGCVAAGTDRVFWATFDESFGPDAVSGVPVQGTPPGPNRFLEPTTIPGHDGQVLRLNHVPRTARTDYSGRVRFIPEAGSGRSPFAFREDDFSISFWMRTRNDHARLITTRQRTDHDGFRQRGIMISLFGGQPEFQMNIGEGQGHRWVMNHRGGPMIADNQWHHVAVVVDRDNDDGGRIFVNGSLVRSFDPTWMTPGSLGNRNFLGLGFDSVTQGNDGDFEIDEIEIYHRTLSHAEIADRVNRPLCR